MVWGIGGLGRSPFSSQRSEVGWLVDYPVRIATMNSRSREPAYSIVAGAYAVLAATNESNDQTAERKTDANVAIKILCGIAPCASAPHTGG